jgi:hypothetical protein
MRLSFRAHYDGKVIVPDEPVELPVNTPITLEVGSSEAVPPLLKTPEERRAAWQRFLDRAAANPVPHVPLEALRRENLYEDR